MQYGLEIGAAGRCDARALGELARLAEEAGWDGIFLEDYIVHWSGQETHDPWIALAAMALNTRHIRLGTTVTPLSRRRPWKLARETVTLDHLSGGRLILGVGLGHVSEPGFARVGEVTDDRQRARRLDEALDVLVGLWSGESFSYRGEHYQVREATFLPKPVQRPRIPIWVGGGWPSKGPAQRAARWDGACFYDMTPGKVRALKAFVEEQRGTSARFDIAVGGSPRRGDEAHDRARLTQMAEAGATWWMEGIDPAELEVIRSAIRRGPLRVD
jgi:alkanesulfonate monooxygenase SsuD/methylene tetrahydromethanopterin reductase-like flavin-dependent oxidoreductase (luciferase family)